MLEPKRRKRLTAKKIIDLYKSGERDFSEIVCTNDSFDGFDLRGIIFNKADLSFCSFYGTNLSGANLSEANLEWTGFIKANLKNADFHKARATWSRFNESQLEKTNFRGADLSWSLFFNANLYGGADLTGAITMAIATDPSQITEEGMKKLAEKLGQMRGKIDPELVARIEMIAGSTKEETDKKTSEKIHDTIYGHDSSGVYSSKGGAQGEYHSQTDAKASYGSGAKGVDDSPYNKKKKHDPYGR